MITQFFILSSRGDAIISRAIRGKVDNQIAEDYFRKYKQQGSDVIPVYHTNGNNVFSIQRFGLSFLAITNKNASASSIFEILNRIVTIIKDFCGFLNEESLRLNFVLVYEILDEIIDYGFVQILDSSQLKQFIFNTAKVKKTGTKILSTIQSVTDRKTTSATNADTPIALSYNERKKTKSQIFVDLFENLTAEFDPLGKLVVSHARGTIYVKSFVKGSTTFELGLNPQLVIMSTLSPEQRQSHLATSSTRLQTSGFRKAKISPTCDFLSFHPSAQTASFAKDRTILFVPSEGETILLQYRISNPTFLTIPLKITPRFNIAVGETTGSVELSLQLQNLLSSSKEASDVSLSMKVPSFCTSFHHTTTSNIPKSAQSVEYSPSNKEFTWTITRLPGQCSETLRVRLAIRRDSSKSSGGKLTRKDVLKYFGNISLSFEIASFTSSGIIIRHFKALNSATTKNAPLRWIRYITKSNNYVFRT